MKTTITADGTLNITPESDLEIYALSRWIEANGSGDWHNAQCLGPKIAVDLFRRQVEGIFMMQGGIKS